MRAVLQRVSQARVTVGGEIVGEIGPGWLVLLGVGHEDDFSVARKLAEKVAHLRCFEDEEGKMNRSVLETGGSVLVVSQFTLLADTSRGRRPSFVAAARPEQAKSLVEDFAEALRELGLTVAGGRFGAEMRVGLVNEGPVTIVLDSDNQR
jgi:D-tyrosyl-tRNA(Tyr) deacylase